jgi:flagellar hook-associated protein 3 FlgL
MANMNEVLQRVRELVLEAANGTNSPADLKNIATVVGQLTETIKQDANTQFAGQYVFSGTQTSTAPYALGEADEYHGNTTLVARAMGSGATVTIGTDLSGVLGNGGAAKDGKLLDVLRTIATHLNEGSAESKAALTSTDLKGLDAGMEGLTQLQANAGSATDQLEMALARIEALQSSVTQTLSNTEDTDVAKATIAYSNQQAAYQAALRAGAKIVQESLLDFLH